MKVNVRVFRWVSVLILILAIGAWVALGPGMRRFLEKNEGMIIARVKAQTDNHMLIDRISGDFWSGVVLERLVIYADHDPAHLPLLSADRVILRLPLMALLDQEVNPSAIHIDGFTVVLHIDVDGSIALPEWTPETASSIRPTVLHAGMAGRKKAGITITCEDGILEIHKRFPHLTETVRVAFTQLEGSGEYIEDEGFRIDSITGDYLASPIVLRGMVPTDPEDLIELEASLGDVGFSTVFRDIDPLFRGSSYLPTGRASLEIRLSGTRKRPEITGSVDLRETTAGNVTIDTAHADVAYSAGVIDLSGVAAEAYGGIVEATGRINLLAESPIWQALCTFEDIDLAEYLDSNGYYAYEVSGGFSGSIDARGDFKDPDALECSALIAGEGGMYLSPFSERFTDVTMGIENHAPPSEADLAEYDELTVSFRVQDSRIVVDLLHFVSQDLQAEARGYVGFDKSIEASGGLTVPLDRARRHPQFRQYVGFLPDTLNRASLEFTISGWLYDAHFTASPGENLLRGLLDQGSDSLHDLGDAFSGFGN